MDNGSIRHSTVSRSELERRIELVRCRLAELGADAFLAVSTDNLLGGYNRWLTDSAVGYRRSVVIYPEALATVIEHGPTGAIRTLSGDDPAYPGVGRVLMTPNINSIAYTQAGEVDLIVGELLAQGVHRVAAASPGTFPSAFLDALRHAKIELLDDSDYMDRQKAIKSREEIVDLREAARIQDEAFAAVLDQIVPGMPEYELAALAQFEMARRKCEAGVVLLGSAPQGTPVTPKDYGWRGRQIERGDAVLLLIEIASPSGYYLELGRMMVLGKAWPGLLSIFDMARSVQDTVISMLVPGQSASQVHQRYVKYMLDWGLAPDLRLFSHGQGFDMVERPLIRPDESMVLEAGMCLSCHPAFVIDKDLGFVCDNVLLKENDRPERLHRTPQRVFELDC